MLTIRPAAPADLGAITEIYNDAILHTTATFDTQPKTLADQQAWFAQHSARYPVLVAEEEGAVVGWASLTPWSDRCAYADTAEISLYVRDGCRGRGLGKQLTAAILAAGRGAGLHTVIACITQGNEASLRLARSCGFAEIGAMREVGRKFGKFLDVHLLQHIYRD